jgi:hypothetical protein
LILTPGTEVWGVASEPSLQGTVIVEVTPEETMRMVFMLADVAEVPLVIELDSALLQVVLLEEGLLIEEPELEEHDVLELMEDEAPTEAEEEALLEVDEVVVATVVDDVLENSEEDEEEDAELVSGVQLAIGNDCTKTPDCVPLLVTSNCVHSSLRNICIDCTTALRGWSTLKVVV